MASVLPLRVTAATAVRIMLKAPWKMNIMDFFYTCQAIHAVKMSENLVHTFPKIKQSFGKLT